MFEKNAEAEIGKYAIREIELTHLKEEIASSIKAAEMAAGVALLDAAEGDADPGIDGVLRARAKSTALGGALIACRARRLDAVRAKRGVAAADFLKQAADLQAEAEKIEAKSLKLLASLSELQSIQYTPVLLSRQPMASVPSIRLADPSCYQTPKSEKLRGNAGALETKAARLQEPLRRDGTVDLESITSTDELALAVLRTEAEVPTAQAILDWAAACERSSRRGVFGDHPRRCRLVWKDGVIDAGESYIFVPALAPRQVGAGGFDVAAATFKAGGVAA
jgi:hypothetical protein